MLESLIILGILAALAVLVMAFGADTRDADDWVTHTKI
ncbi:MAG: hypothetical protein QOH90_921 [Actinomycetota bacterium]|jgi:hypothetical protein|nr:hypothetical protein [Actinomycetota bacterium]